jgi:hypothetical protein
VSKLDEIEATAEAPGCMPTRFESLATIEHLICRQDWLETQD